MKRIKDGIDEMIDLSWDFRIKQKKDDAEIVRNLIVGIPPESNDFTKFEKWQVKSQKRDVLTQIGLNSIKKDLLDEMFNLVDNHKYQKEIVLKTHEVRPKGEYQRAYANFVL